MEQELLEMLRDVEGKDFDSLEAALEVYTGREIFGMWLENEGMIGYTETILDAVKLLNP